MNETKSGHARVAIVGAAIAGTATAWHLAQHGWRDILLIDQGPFPHTGGSTSHAPGNVFQTSPSPLLARFARESVAWYRERRIERRPVFASVGGIELAASPERRRFLDRRLAWAEAAGIEGAAILPPADVAARNFMVDPDTIIAGFHVPSDGHVDGPGACAAAFAETEAAGAARLWAETTVTGITVTDGRVRGLETTRGPVTADLVVLSGGIWGPKLGALAGISVPLMPVDHQGIRIGPIPELGHLSGAWGALPALRQQDIPVSLRQWYDFYLIGNYRREPRLVAAEDILPPDLAPVMPSLLDYRPEEAEEAIALTGRHLPALQGQSVDHGLNGLFCFTPDNMPILGPTPVDGLWLCEALWLTHAPAAAAAVAAWIAEGEPGLDLTPTTLDRFSTEHCAPDYVRKQARQNYRTIYDIVEDT